MSTETREILLVDDEAMQLRLGRSFLSRLGVQVYTAASGNMAIQLLAESLRPDLVVTDINMPDGTGFDLLRYLRASEQLGQVPVIVISGTSDPKEIEEIHSLGCEAFFSKPASFSLVMERIARCLDLKVRLTERYEVRLSGLLFHPSEAPLVTRNLCAGGACFETEVSLEVGGKYAVELQLPEQIGPTRQLLLRCTVVRSGSEEVDGKPCFVSGVKFLFDRDTEPQRRALVRFLRTLPRSDSE